MESHCLGSKIMPNAQGVSIKVIDSKVLSLEHCMIKHLFYASQYWNWSKSPASSKTENFVIKVDGQKALS